MIPLQDSALAPAETSTAHTDVSEAVVSPYAAGYFAPRKVNIANGAIFRVTDFG